MALACAEEMNGAVMSLVQQTLDKAIVETVPALRRIATELSRQRGDAEDATYEIIPGVIAPMWVKYEDDARALMTVIYECVRDGHIRFNI